MREQAMRTMPGLALALCLVAAPALGADWRQVSSNDSYLWYDRDSVKIDEEDYLTFSVYRGAWSEPGSMAANSVFVSVDCYDGYFDIYNGATGKWDEAPSGFVTDALDDLAYGYCYGE
jgi:hypothetical protein